MQRTNWLRKIIRGTTAFTVVTNNRKYLGVTLNKQVKDLYNKNFESLTKEIEEDIRIWKDLPCSWISRINIVKMAILPKAIYRFNAILSKFQQNSLQALKNNTQFHMEKQKV